MKLTGMTFDLDLWPTDLNIKRDHLLIKGYLPTEFEASWAKRSWVISCTRCGRPTWPLTLTFDLLTWISIGIIYSSWTSYLPSLKFMRWGVVELLDTQVVLGGYRRTDRHVQSKMPLPSFEGGINRALAWRISRLMSFVIALSTVRHAKKVRITKWFFAHSGTRTHYLPLTRLAV